MNGDDRPSELVFEEYMDSIGWGSRRRNQRSRIIDQVGLPQQFISEHHGVLNGSHRHSGRHSGLRADAGSPVACGFVGGASQLDKLAAAPGPENTGS